MGTDEIRGVLAAYKEVMLASWPELHPDLEARSQRWAEASDDELRYELQGYLHDSSRSSVRIFWKFTDRFRFAGCNLLFARDAGLNGISDIVGWDDFDERLPWVRQAPKYRADDEEVYRTGTPKLDIVERQGQSEGMHWLRVGKTPIRNAAGEVVGILGMYEVLSSEVGRKLYVERIKNPVPPK